MEAVVHLESKARVSEIKLSGFGTSDNKPKKRQTTGVTGFNIIGDELLLNFGAKFQR